MENGLPLLIENLPEEIDPVLDAVIQKKASRGEAWRGCCCPKPAAAALTSQRWWAAS